ncbi:hypothetical protein Lalb_Chr15g0085721 [Lupinus albus]|uniref:Uncharacterized protein n=1 Tax=Lupinus albus TaxID=3870 RepID=A0A6A4P2E9_LUPAL|nr:hypothetical protein Lalb_Chr15g0085721 [Lupinus albus]
MPNYEAINSVHDDDDVITTRQAAEDVGQNVVLGSLSPKPTHACTMAKSMPIKPWSVTGHDHIMTELVQSLPCHDYIVTEPTCNWAKPQPTRDRDRLSWSWTDTTQVQKCSYFSYKLST